MATSIDERVDAMDELRLGAQSACRAPACARVETVRPDLARRRRPSQKGHAGAADGQGRIQSVDLDGAGHCFQPAPPRTWFESPAEEARARGAGNEGVPRIVEAEAPPGQLSSNEEHRVVPASIRASDGGADSAEDRPYRQRVAPLVHPDG